MTRYTALYWLTTFDHRGLEIDKRAFVGTSQEAIDELKAEYEEFFPTFRGERTDKDAEFWRKRRLELSLGVPRSTRVIGRDSTGKYRSFKMEQITPIKAEE